jgi:hypothetical protein
MARVKARGVQNVNQHTVQQAYLRGFTPKRHNTGAFHLCSRDGQTRGTPRTVCVFVSHEA